MGEEESLAEGPNQLPTEFDSFRGSKDLEKQNKELVSVLLQNHTRSGEWSKATFEGTSNVPLVGSVAFLSEQVKPGHEEGFYLKKAKGKIQGCLQVHLKRPPARLSVTLGPEDQCVEVQLLEDTSEQPVLNVGVDGSSQGRMLKSRGAVRNRVFSVQVGFVDGAPMQLSDETILLEISELGVPPDFLGYKIPKAVLCGTPIPDIMPIMGKLQADPPVNRWEIVGQLPAGLQICSETGAITGIPRESGRFDATVTAVHEAGSSSARLQFLIELDDEGKEVILRDAIASVDWHAHCALRLPAANAAIDVAFNAAFRPAAEKIRLEPGLGNSAASFVRRLLDAMAVSATAARQLSRAIASRAEREFVVPFDFLSIQDALDALGPDGGTVTVLEGMYSGDLQVAKHVLLKGKEGTQRPVLQGHIKVVSGGEYAAFKHLVLRAGAGKGTEPLLSITCGHPIIEDCEMSNHGTNIVRVQRLQGPGTSLALWGNVIHYPPLKAPTNSSILVDDGCRVDAKRNVFFDATQNVQLLGKASMIQRGNALASVNPFEKRDMASMANERRKRNPESQVESFAASSQVSAPSRSFNWSERGVGKRPQTAPSTWVPYSWVPLKGQSSQEDSSRSAYASSPTDPTKLKSRWADEEFKVGGDLGPWAANHCVRHLFHGPGCSGWRDHRDQRRGSKQLKLRSVLKPAEKSSLQDFSTLSISSSCPVMRPVTR